MTQNGTVRCQLAAVDDCLGEVDVLKAWRMKPELQNDPSEVVADTAGKKACRPCMEEIRKAAGARNPWQVAFKGHRCKGVNGEGCGAPTLFHLCWPCNERQKALRRLETRFGRPDNNKAGRAPHPNGEAARQANAEAVARLAHVPAANGAAPLTDPDRILDEARHLEAEQAERPTRKKGGGKKADGRKPRGRKRAAAA